MLFNVFKNKCICPYIKMEMIHRTASTISLIDLEEYYVFILEYLASLSSNLLLQLLVCTGVFFTLPLSIEL